MSEKFVLNGVGKAIIHTTVDGVTRPIVLGTLQDMKLSFSGTTEKVYGGDGRQAIYVINKDQDITVSFTDAKFGLDYINLVSGAELDNNGVLIFDDGPSLVASGTSYTVAGKLTGILPSSVAVSLSDDADGTANVTDLTYTSGTPTSGQFTIAAAGVVTLGAEVTNKYISVSGLYADATAESVVLTAASIPSFVEIHHKSMPIDMGDGTKVVTHTIIYKARSTGKLDVDFKRQTAATPELEFDVFDAGRSDGAVIRMTKQAVSA